jgi:hypothetical protein
MAARKVSRKKGKRGRKPPLHVVSDFGTRGNSPLARKIGNDRKLNAKGNYGAK